MAVVVKQEVDSTTADSILALCLEHPEGIGDKFLQVSMPREDPKVRAAAINKLLIQGKIDILRSGDGTLLYKGKAEPSRAAGIKGDQEEKIVFKIIEEASNKGTWIKDIRIKSNLVQTQLNKVLKSLESKKCIKVVKSINATRKKVYMLYDLEPDRSVSGGAWYSGQDFESEFVEILNQQSYRFLHQKLEASRAHMSSGPIVARNASMSSSKEVLAFISDLGISKVALKVEEIETILDTLIFDGKVERTTVASAAGDVKLYRAVEGLLPPTGLVRAPCGVCPVFRDCAHDIGAVNPNTCQYIKEWLA